LEDGTYAIVLPGGTGLRQKK